MSTAESEPIPGMLMSPQIGELADALATAQGEFTPAPKDHTAKVESTKGGYSYRYSDLAGCIEAVRTPLARHGLSVTQVMVPGRDLMLRTILAHKSGQWIASDFPVVIADWGRPQSVGSAITYARRYTLCAMLQIAQEDDDGGEAERQAPRRQASVREPGDDDRERREAPMEQVIGRGTRNEAPVDRERLGHPHAQPRKSYGPPANGRALFAWAKDAGLVDRINDWAKEQQPPFPGRMVDWSVSQVEDAYLQFNQEVPA